MGSLFDGIAAFFRAVLPSRVVLWLRGDHSSVRGRWIQKPLEDLNLCLSRLRGVSYLEWYARRLDDFTTVESPERREKFRKYMEDGREQFNVIKALGVQPHHAVHEFGLGMGRVAGFLVPYLTSGSFSGNDASGGRIRKGLDYLKQEKGIETDKFLVIVNKDNSFDWLKGRKADYIWCFAIFMHMPERDIEDVMKNVPKIMHDKTVFFFTYSEKDPNRLVDRMGSHDWWHSTNHFCNLADRYGFDMELHTETLRKNMAYNEATRLAAFTLKPAAAR